MSRNRSLFGDVAHRATWLSTHPEIKSHEDAGKIAMARVAMDADQFGEPFFYRIDGPGSVEGVVVAGANGWFAVHTNLGEIDFKWNAEWQVAECAMREPQMSWILRTMILHAVPVATLVKLLDDVAKDPDYSKPEWRRDGYRDVVLNALRVLEPTAKI